MLVNQDSAVVEFPDYLKGKIAVMGFIFTNCPDICPLTTNNMQRIKAELEKENIKDVLFVSLSFDPARDKPFVLKDYARIRNIDLKGWQFLTGKQSVIDTIKKKMHFFAVAADTSYSEDGKKYYFFVHTDRISLIDKQGRVRKNYKGSTINIGEIVNDIKQIM
jgi:protein SCO1/2